jgi:glycosyltransferase involved in cell wall biosynthesis
VKILHLDTERTWRGGERQVLWLADELRKRGHRNWIACRPDFPLEKEARAAGIEVFPISPLFEMDPLAALKLQGLLRRERMDVLHAHTGHAVGLGALATLPLPVKLAATRRVDFHLGRNPFTSWKYGRCDAVIAISRRVREILIEDGVPAERIHWVPSGLRVDGYPSASRREEFRRERGLSPDEKLIVNVAALEPHKDHATLLTAAPEVLKRVPNARFLILGEGRLRNILGHLSQKLDLVDRVRFMGQRPDPLEFTALADVFVLSSQEEGLGTALLDALAIGVPAVATRAGGIPDIFGGAEAPELVPVGDPAALADAIVRVLTDPSEARRRVERGRLLVARLSVADLAEKYERIYEGLLRRS